MSTLPTSPSGRRVRRRPALAVPVGLSVALALVPLAVVGGAAPAAAQDNGAALTPPMGWSSWSSVRSNPTEAKIMAQAKALHDNGLVSHGFTYVNVDDYYYLKTTADVDDYGRWKTDPAKFPNGMKPVGDYVHGLGEKFGMYLTAGVPVAAYDRNTPIEGTAFHARDIVSDTTKFENNFGPGRNGMYYIDYAKNPAAAQAYLDSWAGLLASWGVDYVKLDGVGTWNVPDVQHWSQALNRTGRTVHLGLSLALDVKSATTWRQYANSWRTDGDLECYCGTNGSPYPLTKWDNVAKRFAGSPKWTGFNGPGGWNDLDSLEIGNGPTGAGLTRDEMQTHMTLWAVTNSSLLLGTDLTAMDPTDLAMLKNDEVIAVDQAGRTARPVDQLTQQQTWVTPNPDGSYTVALFNLGPSAADVTARFADLGFSGPATVRDLWTHTELGSFTGSFGAGLNPHASRLLKVTPAAAATYTSVRYQLVNAATGQYLDVSGGSTADGAGLVQAAANGATDQQWQLAPTGDGYFRIDNVRSGRLVNVPGPTTVPGTQLIQYHDDHHDNSQWKLTPTGTGAYTVTSRYDGQNIAVSGGSVVQQTAAAGSTAQQWTLVPVPVAGVEYKLVNANSGGRLDVSGASTADSAGLVQWQDNQAADQRWTFTAQGGDSYGVTNVHSGKALNVPGSTTTAGTQLVQWPYDGNANSRWKLVDAGPNLVQLRSVSDGQAVDVDNGSLVNGGKVLQWPAGSGANQKWSLVSP
ncbi:alpha-galactosidase [Kitasatospora sp. NPDC088783]|uniref:alpha-galactosidase n=1 Tax=Kitasatospora sp. NPDC088783 TaxID=3364077 RepID=UPI003830155C